jgi:hypothetical protein
MSPEVADAIRLLDDASASWPLETQAAWKKVGGFVRARHARAALDAMEGVFGPPGDDEEPSR